MTRVLEVHDLEKNFGGVVAAIAWGRPNTGGKAIHTWEATEGALLVAVGLGFQHYLTMFGSTVAIPLLLAPALGIDSDPVALGWLISTMFFVSGITTLLQTTLGNRLPLVQGGTFSLLAPTFAICGMAALSDAGWQVRLQHVQGAVISGAV